METSFEEIRQLLKELAISQKETDAKFKETDAIIKANAIETDAKFKETDAKFKETDAKFKETDAIIKANAIETDARFKETDAKFKETDAKFKETDAIIKENAIESAKTDRKIKELGKQIGGIGEKFGSFTEGLAYPSLRKILYNKYHIDNTTANFLKRFEDGSEIEFDAFGFTNGQYNNVVVVEVKSHLQHKHIEEFVEELKSFKTNFPDFSQKHLYGILATVRIVSRELKQEIFRSGLHLAIIHDDIFDFKDNKNAIDFNA